MIFLQDFLDHSLKRYCVLKIMIWIFFSHLFTSDPHNSRRLCLIRARIASFDSSNDALQDLVFGFGVGQPVFKKIIKKDFG